MAQKRTILVIEDEDVVRGLISESLEEEGFHVIAASGPDQGREAVRDHLDDIDLLFTDMMLPGVRGDALAAELVRMKPGLKVLFTSGFIEEEIEPDNAPDGKPHFLQKPFTPEALVAKIREVLAGK